MGRITITFLLAIFFSVNLFAEDLGKAKILEEASKEQLRETFIETLHSVRIDEKELKYKAQVGNILLKDDKGKAKGSIFYVSYIKEDVDDNSKRPITFCFNGGPGSSSVWLHLGTFGPRRVYFEKNGYTNPPYQLVHNEYSILDLTDLVFIDPVSTGYSREAPGEDAKQFHGYEEDIKSIGEFIRIFITRHERWDSPKYLGGESYGTTRAAGLAGYLHNDLNMYINGIILISSILNFQTINDINGGNDFPYIFFLPSYTATAWYHKKLSDDLQKNLEATLKESQDFALNEYASALMHGDLLSIEKRNQIIEKLARYTGLSQGFITRSNIRISTSRFTKELLRENMRTVGRFDSRLTGIDSDASGESFEYDPSLNDIIGAFTATFNQYVRKELNWKNEEEYKILTSIGPWNWGTASSQCLNASETLREVMTKNPTLKVFVGSGFFDLATPYFGTEYTFNHLGLDPHLKNQIKMYYYVAGHMMYTDFSSLVKLKKDLASWMQAQ